MSAIMEKWETHLPQQAEEEVRTEATPARADVSEAKETALNPRIQALKAARDEAERKLQEAILDLETREQSPAFHRAKELFVDGWRLDDIQGDEGFRYFNLVSPDHDETEITYVPGRNATPIIIDGHKDVFKALGLSDDPTRNEVLHYLVSLTEEVS